MDMFKTIVLFVSDALSWTPLFPPGTVECVCDKEDKIIDVTRSNDESAMDEILRHLLVTVVMDIVSEHNADVAKNKVSFALLIITERSDGRSSNFKL